MDDLGKLRKKIDEIDEKMLDLLNKRAKIVLEVAGLKQDKNSVFYAPDRERKIIERLKALNSGPFPDDALKVVFREIISASLSMEKPLEVACLGPLATFTHLAGVRHFGSSARFLPVNSIREVFEAVENSQADYGIVPIENSTEGVVSYTLDMFVDFDLNITAEVMLEISHNLLSVSGKVEDIKKIYSHPQAFAQCRTWLERNLPDVQIFDSTSTSKAAELAAGDPTSAAIASELAAKTYNLEFVHRNIEDNKKNYTRFLVISKSVAPKTGNDKTSIMFTIKDRPGALYDILTPFKKSKINLKKIESRPSRRKAWEYIFFVDMEGHIDDKAVKKAIENITDNCLYLKFLGSYPLGE
ncbi:P-protein [bacterium BMS3Abin07]|nr:P-protein [bacterium BMS3Abin07]GBE32503.1 P-protein [bacterium BMS3Bbin05]HDL20942.1 prephenate dehydratase [Nitrospirota bacterium]HDO21696.1 prephenate dehydratase [Nitrospirota bacterium]HDZ87504.1 prephenate dehydratase [Nitrospirota bacterium]